MLIAIRGQAEDVWVIMVMRTYLRRLVSAVLPLMVIGMAGIAVPQNASAESQGATSLAASD
jgi:hypothetical protein